MLGCCIGLACWLAGWFGWVGWNGMALALAFALALAPTSPPSNQTNQPTSNS